jgi:hypothetical protein
MNEIQGNRSPIVIPFGFPDDATCSFPKEEVFVKRFLLGSLLLAAAGLAVNGCLQIDTLTQPAEVDQGTVLVVHATGSFTTTWGSSYAGWIAFMLPKGCVPDSIVYTGDFAGVIADTNQNLSDTAALYHATDPGMDWWGMKTPSYSTNGGTYTADIYIKIHPYADTGLYYIDYLTGSDYSGAWVDSVMNQPLRIKYVVGVEDGPAAELASRPGTLSAEPNPFRTATTIAVSMPGGSGEASSAGCQSSLRVYDASGRSIRDLSSKLSGMSLQSGPGRLAWDGTDDSGRLLGSGVFFLRFASGGHSLTKPVVILR